MSMYQTNISSVHGGICIDDKGNTLQIIGNKIINAGDVAWTDGKCVYGFEQTGGGSPIITKEPMVVPLYGMYHILGTQQYLFYYDISSNKIKKAGPILKGNADNWYSFVLNKNGEFAILYGSKVPTIRDKTYPPIIDDADMDNNRKVYKYEYDYHNIPPNRGYNRIDDKGNIFNGTPHNYAHSPIQDGYYQTGASIYDEKDICIIPYYYAFSGSIATAICQVNVSKYLVLVGTTPVLFNDGMSVKIDLSEIWDNNTGYPQYDTTYRLHPIPKSKLKPILNALS